MICKTEWEHTHVRPAIFETEIIVIKCYNYRGICNTTNYENIVFKYSIQYRKIKNQDP
jgi:hypothetical protein